MSSNVVLSPLAVAYAAVTRFRTAAYRKGLLKTTRLPVPVVSIGNITVGGTGKTPLVAHISRVLADEGRNVCILTRGYGRKDAGKRVVVSDGVEVLADVHESGDEPFWLAENLKGVAAVICDPDRAAAGRWALEHLDSNVFVLDDGFQHHQLARDLNILAIDATNPWGGGRLLPAGRLREAPQGASRADCAIITRAAPNSDLQELKTTLQHLMGDRPIFTSHMQTKGVRELGTTGLDPGIGIPQPVAAFCAVGNPASFFDHLLKEGLALVHTHAFPDHHQYKQADITRISEEAKRAGAASLMTTAKDAVKLNELKFDLPCYVLEIEISIEEEEKLVDLIRTAISPS
jgi:tetraacyldisaccharide 4'-kinase